MTRRTAPALVPFLIIAASDGDYISRAQAEAHDSDKLKEPTQWGLDSDCAVEAYRLTPAQAEAFESERFWARPPSQDDVSQIMGW
jgi:hypothetical protein